MQRLGRIVRLQVQVAPLKHGERPDRGYDAGRIRRVTNLEVGEHGVVGYDGDARESIVDFRHRDHPETRYRGDNGINLLTTGHYALMRERFGSHVPDGIAGESVLVEAARLAGPFGPDGWGADRARRWGRGCRGAPVRGVSPAQPCVEFNRLVSGIVASGSVRAPLAYLLDSMRGYYLQVKGGAGTVLRKGNWVFA